MHGTITHIEALLWYQTQDLAGRIRELRKTLPAHQEIKSVFQKDALGNRFVRYTLVTAPMPTAQRQPIPRDHAVVLYQKPITAPYRGPAVMHA